MRLRGALFGLIFATPVYAQDFSVDSGNGKRSTYSRLGPPPKRGARLVRVKLYSVTDARKEMAKLYREARAGKIDVQDASRMANIFMLIGRMIEGSDFERRLGVDLPDVLTLALSSPSQSVMDVLTGEGLGDLDLAAVSVLAVPLWALPVADRPTVAALCEHP